jgi:hypothetical protein
VEDAVARIALGEDRFTLAVRNKAPAAICGCKKTFKVKRLVG